MSELKTKDFEGLSIPEYTKKLAEVNSIDFLQSLSVNEQAEGDRKGIYSAISDRMEEISAAEAKASDSVKPVPPAPKEEQEPQLGNESNEESNKLAEAEAEEEGEGEGEREGAPELSKEEFIETVKEKRLSLDRIYEFAKAHGRIDTSPDDSIFLAKAWLGKMLAAFSAETPYKKDEKKEIQSRADIPPTAEKDLSTHFRAECHQFNLKDTFKAAIELRSMLEEVIQWLDSLDVNKYNLGSNARNASVCRTQAFIHASEAKFFLGVILSNQKV